LIYSETSLSGHPIVPRIFGRSERVAALKGLIYYYKIIAIMRNINKSDIYSLFKMKFKTYIKRK
jgi:hypothetical protein